MNYEWRMKQGLKKFFKELRFYTILIVVSILLAAGMRVFLFAQFRIPSDSMEPSVLAGEFIVVNKQIPGPRVYRNIRQLRIDGKVQTKRFKGIRQVRRNDVLVFNFPYSGDWSKIDMDLNVYYLKRCVALPGDTFLIKNGIYGVNNRSDSLGSVFRQQELSHLSQDDFSEVIWRTFPYDTAHYDWNIKDFGPLYVPSSGATIRLDTLNFRLYKNLIEYETDQKLHIRDGSIYLNDTVITTYTFLLNYYFMAGDLIFNSQDSRYWGLLPEDCIIGKAVLVWKSTELNSGKIRWNRIFKKIK